MPTRTRTIYGTPNQGGTFHTARPPKPSTQCVSEAEPVRSRSGTPGNLPKRCSHPTYKLSPSVGGTFLRRTRGVVAMAPSALMCWCAHCGALRRLRAEGDFASCASCGRVLLELRGDADAAAAAVAGLLRQGRCRRKRREAHTVGRGRTGPEVGARSGRDEMSDAESAVITA